MAVKLVYVVQRQIDSDWIDISPELPTAPDNWDTWDTIPPANHTQRLISREYTVTETVQ